jgi:EAL domain-containing protein (putative c-di-GMP-specific phosphodiesterase class I)
VLIEQPETHLETLTRLREAGVQISIDDFGTGYSSLNYLSELPIDVLKIDGSFVRRLGKVDIGPRSRVIPELIIEMAHRLELNVVAEVVETVDQLDELRRMGCDVGQGYYFNRPLHPDQVAELLRDQSAGASEERTA